MAEFEPYGGKEKSLQDSIDNLTKAVNSMIELLKGAEKELSKEPSGDQEISKRLERLIEQNKDMAKAILLLLELNRENLPKIAAHTKESSRLMRRPFPSPRPEPRMELGPRPMTQMPLPPEPTISRREIFPSIPEPPKPEPKKKGLFGLGKK